MTLQRKYPMKKTLFALAMAAALPFAAQAQDQGLSYTWAEADYVDLDGGADGWGLRGSYNFGDTGFYAFGGYSWLNADDGIIDVDAEADELGIGYHHSIAGNTDLIGELAYKKLDADSYRVDGLRTSVGVRSAMTKNFEGFVKANYYDASDYDGDVTGTVGAQFKFSPMWGITGEAEFGNGDQAYLVGLRASF
jgi:Ax21 family sulfation-dependent quorum factor